jgi:quercetin dioxygenase-like cupin family protein
MPWGVPPTGRRPERGGVAHERDNGCVAMTADDATAWWFLDTLVVERHLARRSTTTVLEMTLPVGAAPPLHIHYDYDDSFYLLAGQVVVRCGDTMRLARPGDFVSAARGTAHAFRVVGDEAARILAVSDSDSFLKLVRELGEPAGALALPPADLSPGVDEVLRSFAIHDVTVIGQSLGEEVAQAFLASPS